VWILGWLGFFPGNLAVPGLLSALPLLPALIVAVIILSRGFPTFAGAGMLVATFYLGLAFLLGPLAGKDMNAQLHRNSAIIFKELAAQLKPEDHVVMMYRYRPSLAFYTQRIPVLYDLINEMRYGMDAEPQLLKYAEKRGELGALIAQGTGRWFGVLDREDMGDFIENGFDTNTPVLISNCDLTIVDITAGQR
jgi:hypothetical protein